MVTQQPIYFRTNNQSHATNTEHCSMHGVNQNLGAITARQTGLPAAGKLKELNIKINTAPGSGKSYKFTVVINGTPSTNITGSISNTDTELTITADETIAQEDLIVLEIDPTGTPATFDQLSGNVIWEPTTDDEYVIPAGRQITVSNATSYGAVHTNFGNYNATESDNFNKLFPAAGTLKKFAVHGGATPGSGETYDFTIQKDTGSGFSDTALTVQLDNADFSKTDTSNAVTIAAGDILRVKCVGSAGANAIDTWASFIFVPDTAGEIPWIGGMSNLMIGGTSTEYSLPGAGTSWSSNKTLGEITLVNTAITVKAFYFELSVAPGSGNGYDLHVEKNDVDQLSIDIDGTATTGNATGSIDYAAGDRLIIQHTAVSSPVRAEGWFGIVFTFGSSVVQVLKSSILKHNIIEAIPKSTILKNNIDTSVSKSSILKNNIIIAIQKSSILKNQIIQAITKSSILKNNLIEAITKSSILKHNILNIIVVTKSIILKHQIIQAILKSSILKHNILNIIVVTKNSILKHNIIEAILKASILKHNIIQAITKNSILKNNIETTITKSSILKNNIINTIQKSTILKHQTIEAIQKFTLLKHNILDDFTAPIRVAVDSIIHTRQVSSEILSRVVDSVMRR